MKLILKGEVDPQNLSIAVRYYACSDQTCVQSHASFAHRYWKKIYVRLVVQGDNPCIQLFENKDAKDPFQELPLQTAYSLSEISHQVFDQYNKIFTLKLQYIFYKERAGIRPGQISKVQRLTDKIGFLAKAVEDADYQGVKEFASDMKKLGVPLEHAPQVKHFTRPRT